MKTQPVWINLTVVCSMVLSPLSSLFTTRLPGALAAPLKQTTESIASENELPGSPPTEWDISGAGDASIQGFATDISYNRGETAYFKIDTTATEYEIRIYRLGYYGGDGARLIATIPSSQVTETDQPECTLSPIEMGGGAVTNGQLLDCGNWSVSASWQVPIDATSGVYIARPTRTDTGGASHIVFIVRDDSSTSDLLFQTSDTTWQSYNPYGGYNAYGSSGATMAEKLSYNRPFTTRGAELENWLFNAEYPMIRWLERNGYDVSYMSAVDIERYSNLLTNHKVYLSVGHDEYWSQGRRDAVTTARDAGVHLTFFSGNEIYWKIRWENSTADGGSTPYRTQVVYKEGSSAPSGSAEHRNCFNNYECDPSPIWTGQWREASGSSPENSLSGQISWRLNTAPITVPGEYAGLRFWRNTEIATLGPNDLVTLSDGTLGYEWDPEYPAYADYYPDGRILLSSTDVNSFVGPEKHHLSLYRAPSGALVFGAGTVQWSWGLDGNHDRDASTEDVRMQQASVNLLADMGVQPATLQANLLPATASMDNTAPVSTITAPADGATVSGLVTISGTAADSGGVVAGVEVSVDNGLTWQPATGRETWTFAWLPGALGAYTILSRAFDDSGNIGTPSAGINVTVGTRVCDTGTPCSIWDAGTTPGAQEADPSALEVGVKFRSDVDGFVTGIRFYKHASNTGQHTGNLWTTGGVNLGSVVFSGEAPTGWQEALFAAPVAITAGVTYIASYHTPTGYYAASGGYFTSSGVDNPPLHALASGVDGPNGVYVYSPVSAFPTQTYNAANYWVDLVFLTSTGPDVNPPVVSTVTPAGGATGVAIGSNVTARFNEAMDPATLTSTTFELRGADTNPVPSAVTYNPATRTATLDPDSALAYSTSYTACLLGGAAGAADLAGNPLASDYCWSFTTAAEPPPPPDEGPGGPILVIAAAANPFGRYFAEILRNEGLNAFTVTDISLVTPAVLASYQVAILGEMVLTPAQVTTLADWVNAGGNLIAMRPDAQLAALAGITPAGATLADAYILIETGSGPGVGLVNQTIQFHSAADLYTLNGATAVAMLYSSAATPTAYPAVTLHSVGANGGQVAAFTFDLARSVVYTRQGNPLWAETDRDVEPYGGDVTRANDKFYGNAVGDPQPDYIDLNKVAIPQADEQQRLLANLILSMNVDQMPLPRFWYFPRGEKAVIVMTMDEHGGGDIVGRLNQYVNRSPVGCNVDDWECVRGTMYMYTNAPISDAQAANFQTQGFQFALHTNTGCANFTLASLTTDYATQLVNFAAAFPSLTPTRTQRTHCVVFSDWSSQPTVQLLNNIRLDTNYYYWPPDWIQNRPGMFTGSGMPMRFAELDGTLIDVYQATTQMTDESGQTYPYNVDTLLDNATGPAGYYGAFTANMHTDGGANATNGADAIVLSAQARGVPVISAEQLLDWLDGRNGSSFQNLAWNGSQLTFSVAIGAGGRGLQVLLPAISEAGPLSSLTLDGAPVSYQLEMVKGLEYARYNAAPGLYAATYETDTTPPVISAVTAAPDDIGAALVSWATDELSTSRVDYGLAADNLDLYVSLPDLVTNHQISLSGLAPATTYYYRVTSVDAYANSATFPPVGEAPLSFTTPLASLVDTTAVDFSAGSPGVCYVAQTADGELLLGPTVGSEFDGLSLPAGWAINLWPGGTAPVVNGGLVTVNGSYARYETLYGAGRSLEFVATFGAQNFQSVGFGGGDLTFNQGPWIMFSTGNDAAELYARITTSAAGPYNTGDDKIGLGAQYLGSPHRFRIDWGANQITFWIDGVVVASRVVTLATPMRVAISDYPPTTPVLSVDWLHMSPYSSPCSFESRVFDAGSAVIWGSLSWVGQTPAGTSLGLEYRIGNTAAPDASWTGFSPVTGSGASLQGSSRYIQYRATLQTTAPDSTPILERVAFSYTPGTDELPPVIVSRDPQNGAVDVPRSTNVVVTFNEPLDPATVTPGSLSLRKQGALVDVPAALSLAFDTITLNPDVYLEPGVVYLVTVAGTIGDTAGNPLGAADTWSFTTNAVEQRTHTTVADFAAGSGTCPVDSTLGDGGLRLPLTLEEEFTGISLPAGWVYNSWTGGTPVVSSGLLSVNGLIVGTSAGYAPGIALEFVATFSADTFQHVGFVDSLAFNGPWAMFSTFSTVSGLYARTNPGENTLIPGSYLGAPHRYRIEWESTVIRYYIDGSLVATHPYSIAGPMIVMASDYTLNAAGVSVDWYRLTPYLSPCTYESAVMDVPPLADWLELTWLGNAPSGTGVSIATRSGDSPAPDGSWTAWQPLGGTTIPNPNSRYLQYQLSLSTSIGNLTPVVESVTVSYSVITNRAPVAADQAVSTAEDTPLAITLSASDADNDPLSYTVVDAPLHGGLSGTAPDLTYTPALDYVGPDSFTFKANDGQADSNIATVTITVSPVNDPPVASDQAVTTAEDTPLAVTLTAADVESDPLSYSIVSGPAHGTLSGTAPDLTYTPALDYVGPDTFTFKANDGQADSNIATVTIDVGGVNDPPVAVDDAYTTDEDTLLTIAAPGVLVNDTDLDSASLTAVLVSAPSHGSMTLNADGSFTYTPALNFNGADSFTYKANDGDLDSNVAAVTITVSPVNDPPVAANDAYATDEDTPLTIIAPGVLVNDADIEGDGLTSELISPTSSGSLVLNADGSFVYTPIPNWNGVDSFTYRAADGIAVSDDATVTITINSINDPPVAADQAVTTPEDTLLAVTLAAVDIDSTLLTYSIVAGPSHGVLSGAAPDLVYTPDANTNGPDSFTFKANDGQADSNTATVAITVYAVNDPPVAADDAYTTDEDTPLAVTLAAADVESDPLSYSIVSGPAHGTLSGTAPDLTYTPALDYVGPDSFTFKANDGQADSNVATVTIDVGGVNDPPVAADDAYTTDEDTPLTIAAPGVLGNDTDLDSASLTAVLLSAPAHGSLALNADGSFTYTPALNYNGADSFTYKANDGDLDSNIATVSITVSPVNDPPVANDQAATTAEDTPLAINLAASDVESDLLSYSIVSGPAHGTLSGVAPDLTYTPALDYVGPDSFTFKANDGQADSNTATVTIDVGGVNDPPVAADDAYATDEDTPLAITLTAADVESDPLSYSIVSGPAHGTLSGTAPDLIYTPALDYVGPDSFTFKANDGQADSNIATVTITVSPVNDPPVANDQAVTTAEDTPLAITLTAADVESDPLSYSIVSGPAHGTLSGVAPDLTYTPALDYVGPDSFTFKANDGQADSNTATVTIDVGGVNDPPVAVDDGYMTPEDTALVVPAPGVLENDYDADEDSLTAIPVDGPTYGSLTLNADGSFEYTPELNYFGVDSFTYKVNDGQVDSNVATVSLTIDPVNDPPVAYDQTVTMDEDTSAAITLVVWDAEVDYLCFEVGWPAQGQLSGEAPNLVYTPDPNFNGTVSFVFRAASCQWQGGGIMNWSNYATVTITVSPVNDPPAANDDDYTMDENTVLIVPAPGVLGNDTDADGDTLLALLVSGPTIGGLTLNLDGSFEYTPEEYYFGEASFVYTAYDSNGGLSSATVRITISGQNNPPELAPIPAQQVAELSLLTFTASASDPDTPPELLVYSLSNAPEGAALDPSSGVFTWTPGETQGPGFYEMIVCVTDDESLSDCQTVSITVNEVNQPPVLDPLANQDVLWSNLESFQASASDADIPANTLTFSLVDAPNGASIDPLSGLFTWTPTSAQVGVYTYTVRVSDSGAPVYSAEQVIRITVEKRPVQVVYNGPGTGQYTDNAALAATLTDVGGGSLQGSPLAGKTIQFTINGQSASGVTNSAGVAQATVQLNQQASLPGVSATFAGDSIYLSAADADPFSVTQEDAAMRYSGGHLLLSRGKVTYQVTVWDSAAAGYPGQNPESGPGATIGDITRIWVVFDMYQARYCGFGAPARTFYARVTDSGPVGDGIGTASTTFTTSSIISYCVISRVVAGTGGGTNVWYTAQRSQPAGITFYANSGRYTVGGGWVNDPDGGQGHFGYNVRPSGTKFTGQFFYSYRGLYNGELADIIVRAGTFTSLTFSGTSYPILATVQGRGTIQIIRVSDGATVFTSDNATFTARLRDTGSASGVGVDTFELEVKDRYCVVFKLVPAAVLGGGEMINK